MTAGNFERALGLDIQLIEVLRALLIEHYMLTGYWLSAADLRAAMLAPS